MNLNDRALALTIEQAADAIGIGRTKLYELVGSGAVPSVKIGARRVIPIEALREWLRSQVSQIHAAAEKR